MKRFTMLWFLAVSLVWSQGTEITKTIVFPENGVAFRQDHGYDVVAFKGCIQAGDSGSPQLPVKVLNFLLPPTLKATDLTWISQTKDVSGQYSLIPAQPARPFAGMSCGTEQNPRAYGQRTPFPKQIAEIVSQGFMAGNRIVSVRVYPLQYVPAEGKLLLDSRITLTLHCTGDSERGVEPLRLTQQTRAHLQHSLEEIGANPEAVSNLIARYPTAAPLSTVRFNPTDLPSLVSCPVSYVIITSDALAASFQSLANWKTEKGIPAVVRTLSWIRMHYDGQDDQEKIRNFIRDAYVNWGTMWILIGGDATVIPYREAAINSGAPHLDPNLIATDLYYACLDGNWNANGNAFFGEEYVDGTDLYPDVSVGRATVSSASDAASFVSKIISYEMTNSSAPNANNVASMLCLGGVISDEFDGGDLCDSVTSRHVPAGFPVTKLYERNGDLNHQQVVDSLNRGFGLVYSVTHGGQSYLQLGGGDLDRLGNADMDSLRNAGSLSIWYAVSCHTNEFQYDCISRHFLSNPSGGGVAYVGSTTTDDPTFLGDFDTLFFNYLFGADYRIGDALYYSEAYFAGISEG